MSSSKTRMSTTDAADEDEEKKQFVRIRTRTLRIIAFVIIMMMLIVIGIFTILTWDRTDKNVTALANRAVQVTVQPPVVNVEASRAAECNPIFQMEAPVVNVNNYSEVPTDAEMAAAAADDANAADSMN